ncbi:TrkH family potassium uptake protein [Tropicimonas sp. S265A]|uniref:TrkH family potassium uptake protein n=1 Tax=Tropicimonas sp. S265A TaxID=3415134 RepID=UPI003C79D91C
MLLAARSVPLFVQVCALGAAAMYAPAIFGAATRDLDAGRPFFYGATLFLILLVLVGLATSRRTRRIDGRAYLATLLAIYTLLPVMLALPLREAVPASSFLNAYVEMVSALTTTGASVFDPDRLPMTVHLWRGIVGWFGGLLIWITAFAVLAPLTLGGFEVTSETEVGSGNARVSGAYADPHDRVMRFAGRLTPIYVTLTAALWLFLVIAGQQPASALLHAMATLSTSGISTGQTVGEAGGGFGAELAVFAFFFFAVTRRLFEGGLHPDWHLIRRDRELRIALIFISAVPVFLFFRHWVGAFEVDGTLNSEALPALWGGIFMVLSFLTTTGLESASWDEAQNWSGLQTPGLLLAGIALFGGGVATTAGGVKLLRVYALYKHGVREMERLIHPSSIGRAGYAGRRLRREGAAIAWIFFMLFALSIAGVMALLSLTGIAFEESAILAIASLATTGPVAVIASEAPIVYSALPDMAKVILCGAMVLGRMETLAILALLNPDFWRN